MVDIVHSNSFVASESRGAVEAFERVSAYASCRDRLAVLSYCRRVATLSRRRPHHRKLGSIIVYLLVWGIYRRRRLFFLNGPGDIRSFPSWHCEIAAQPALKAGHRTPLHHHSFRFDSQTTMAQGIHTNGDAAEDGSSAGSRPLELTVLGMNSGTSMVSALQQVDSPVTN